MRSLIILIQMKAFNCAPTMPLNCAHGHSLVNCDILVTLRVYYLPDICSLPTLARTGLWRSKLSDKLSVLAPATIGVLDCEAKILSFLHKGFGFLIKID